MIIGTTHSLKRETLLTGRTIDSISRSVMLILVLPHSQKQRKKPKGLAQIAGAAKSGAPTSVKLELDDNEPTNAISDS
jgi:hypothetical protein